MKEQFVSPKQISELVVRRVRLELIRLGDATKTEISKGAEISFPTVSRIVDQMAGDGEIQLAGTDRSSGGRRAQRYRLNPDFKHGLALYIEREDAFYTVINYLGEVLEQEQTGIKWELRPDTLTDIVAELIGRYPKIGCLSLGVPGSVKNGISFHIPNFPAYQNFDLKTYYESRLPLKVEVENDMNAAVLGYHESFTKADNPTLVYLFLGTKGPGAGILINGDVVRGSSFFSGEISYIPQYDNMNFADATKNGRSRPEQTRSEPLVIDSLARMVSSLVAVINPHAVIFCREDLNEEAVEEVTRACAKYVPAEHVPRLVLRDRQQDYLNGLKRIALSRMISEV
ncbi:ROK family protein [Paenibacillus pinistramenti]|uniref:ROK family protein n=1 Tax=Paenibacillus pinistramenti TaxID=1768003 RepID=UPI00110964DF|nr:ROK family protein [Paenibacillus pinistramenti]